MCCQKEAENIEVSQWSLLQRKNCKLDIEEELLIVFSSPQLSTDVSAIVRISASHWCQNKDNRYHKWCICRHCALIEVNCDEDSTASSQFQNFVVSPVGLIEEQSEESPIIWTFFSVEETPSQTPAIWNRIQIETLLKNHDLLDPRSWEKKHLQKHTQKKQTKNSWQWSSSSVCWLRLLTAADTPGLGWSSYTVKRSPKNKKLPKNQKFIARILNPKILAWRKMWDQLSSPTPVRKSEETGHNLWHLLQQTNITTSFGELKSHS